MKGLLYHPIRKLLPGLAIISLLFPGLSLAGTDIFDPNAEYSAVRVIKANEGEATMRVFHARDKERFVIESEGQSMTMITRLDRQISWILMPDEKMYMEIPLDQTWDQMEEMGSGVEAEFKVEDKLPKNFKKVGTETIAGLKTTKYKGDIRDEDTGERGTATYWVTDSGILAKMVYEGTDEEGKPQKMTMELRDLKVGRQPAELFEPPADYKPFQMSFGTMMGLGRNAQRQPSAQMSQQSEEDDSDIVSDIAKEAGDEAKSSVTEEVKRSVRDAVKGFFGR